MTKSLPTIGVIGLGRMGGAMARNLANEGYRLTVYDIDPVQIIACTAVGAQASQSAIQIAQTCDVIVTSLHRKVSLDVIGDELLPNLRPGQIVIQTGTVVPQETRDLAQKLSERGAILLDAPVSGGQYGAEHASMHIFVGGDETSYQRCRPILEVLGNSDHIVYCGPSGTGQVVKLVNQIAMSLTEAAHLEALAFGALAGIDIDVMAKGVGSTRDWRAHFRSIATKIMEGRGDTVNAKFPQIDLFLTEAPLHGAHLPLTKALKQFGDLANCCSLSNKSGRKIPLLWSEYSAKEQTSE